MHMCVMYAHMCACVCTYECVHMNVCACVCPLACTLHMFQLYATFMLNDVVIFFSLSGYNLDKGTLLSSFQDICQLQAQQ